MWWIQIEVIDGEEQCIFLPDKISQSLKNMVYISFGQNYIFSKQSTYKETQENKENAYSNPLVVRITRDIVEQLLLIDSLIYQFTIERGQIIIGPVIAFLLGGHTNLYNPDYMKKYSDRLGIYDKIGGLLYGFSPKAVDWNANAAYGIYYNAGKDVWQFGKFPIAQVIYRRNFHTPKDSINKLIKATKNKVFNSYRFSKDELYEYVKEDKQLAKHLIPSEILTSFSQLMKFIKAYKKIILKPIDLSRGRGICIIDTDGEKFSIFDYRHKEVEKIQEVSLESLEKFFLSNILFFDKYMIQKYINLAKVKGSVYDVRVVMQKKSLKLWKLSGVECRVANPNLMITNISRGGYALGLAEALNESFPMYSSNKLIKHEIDNFCQRLCMHLDRMGEHFAEFGIDIALDENRNLWLIEVNVFPSFKGFKKLDYETYLKIRYAPLIYAVNLTEFKKSVDEGSEING